MLRDRNRPPSIRMGISTNNDKKFISSLKFYSLTKHDQERQYQRTDQEYISIPLELPRLQSTDCQREALCYGSQAVERAIDHVAIEPGDTRADTPEDDLVGDKLVNFVDIETVVGRLKQRYANLS